MTYIVILISLHDSSLDAALLDDKHSWMTDLHFARVTIAGVGPSKLRKKTTSYHLMHANLFVTYLQ